MSSSLADDAEFRDLRRALAAVTPLSEAALQAFPRPRRVELAAGEVFLAVGERALETALVHRGGLREVYLLPDGRERTRSFNLPGEFAGSLSDLLAAAPSRLCVVAEVPSVLLLTRWADYLALVDSSPDWQRFARRLAEQLYLRKVEREYELLALDAADRHRAALARWPTLEQVFRQHHIASYLGVTPVHLSRLRRAAAARA